MGKIFYRRYNGAIGDTEVLPYNSNRYSWTLISGSENQTLLVASTRYDLEVANVNISPFISYTSNTGQSSLFLTVSRLSHGPGVCEPVWVRQSGSTSFFSVMETTCEPGQCTESFLRQILQTLKDGIVTATTWTRRQR